MENKSKEEERNEAMEQLMKDLNLDLEDQNYVKKRYTEGWDPNKLEEELAKHPFFCKDLPKAGDPVPPLIEGLQDLKYSPDENTSEELAKSYKEDGVWHFKIKKYRVAITCFGESMKYVVEWIKEAGEDPKDALKFQAQLYNNRSAAHFFLENYGSCIRDCQKAIELDKNYFKPIFRAIQCSHKLGKWEKLVDFSHQAETVEPENSEIRRLRILALRKMKEKSLNSRLGVKDKIEKRAANKIIQNAIAERGIICKDTNFLDEDFKYSTDRKVTIGEDGRLIWPVLIYYSEFNQSDFIEYFDESSTFEDQLIEMFETSRPSWDVKNEYHLGNLDLYFINFGSPDMEYIKVDIKQTLGETMKNKRYILPSNGIPGFFLFANNSFYEHTKKQHKFVK